MARVETTKTINPTQLGVELGRVPLRYVEGSHVASDAVTQQALEQAIDAHVADPAYVDPQAPPPAPDPIVTLVAAIDQATTINGLRNALKTHLPKAFGR